jgi:hypothetical protein
MGVGGVGWRRGEKEGERRRKGRCVAVLMFRDDIGGARAWLIYDSHSAHC